MYRLFFLSILLFCNIFSQTFDDSTNTIKHKIDPVIVGVSLTGGSLLPYRQSQYHIPYSNQFGIGLSYAWQQNGLDVVEHCGCSPRLGFKLLIFKYAEVYGENFTFSLFYDYIFGRPGAFNLFVRGSIGLGYLTKPFDEISNPLNKAYSTSLSEFLAWQIGANFRLDKNNELQISAVNFHNSNGNLHGINAGLDFLSFQIGYNYNFDEIYIPSYSHFNKDESLDDFFVFAPFLGMKQIGDYKRLIYGSSISKVYSITNTNELLANLDFEINYSLDMPKPNESEPDGFLRSALYLGHQFDMGKTRFGQAIGYHIISQFGEKRKLLVKYSLYYFLLDDIGLGIETKLIQFWKLDFSNLILVYRF